MVATDNERMKLRFEFYLLSLLDTMHGLLDENDELPTEAFMTLYESAIVKAEELRREDEHGQVVDDSARSL